MLNAISKQFRLLVGRGLRESAQALDRAGSRMTGDVAYLERYSRHRKLMPLDEQWPSHGESFIAPSACLAGQVMVGNNCSVWYGSVLRGDASPIRIGDNVFIGENTTMTTVSNLPEGIPNSTNIADYVIIEDNVTLISCLVDSYVRIGRGAVVQPGAKLERGCIILPNTVVSPGQVVPAYTVWQGNPAQFVRDTTPQDVEAFEKSFNSEVQAARTHLDLLTHLGH
mmetsp:Transcript_10476/g.15680  ORF Transcript_10476/g.15680 Transcript_10476/m.15680 type:complete len:225 (+) Transcript_10476:959-1633(+)